jgi:hypothetical protein
MIYIVFDTLREHFRDLAGKSWTKAEAVLPRGGSVTFSFEYSQRNTGAIA